MNKLSPLSKSSIAGVTSRPMDLSKEGDSFLPSHDSIRKEAKAVKSIIAQ
jgi:hypothetical protein